MSEYPSAVYEPRTKENKSGVSYAPEETTKIFAEDIIQLDDEVVAIENELGANLKSVYSNLAERILRIAEIVKQGLINGRIYLGIETSSTSNFSVSLSSGGTASYSSENMTFRNGSTSGSQITIEQLAQPYSPIQKYFDSLPRINLFVRLSRITYQTIFFGLGDSENTICGFKIVNGTLYGTAKWINPSTEETETQNIEITGVTLTEGNYYTAEYVGGGVHKFYVNGEYKGQVTGITPEYDGDYNTMQPHFQSLIINDGTGFHYVSFSLIQIDYNL